MKIGIIGMGHVGHSMRDLFRNHADLVTYDQAHDSTYPQEALEACDFAVVCVNTPPGSDGECDVTHVVDAIKRVPTQRILLKSTVPPGTTAQMADATGKDICFSPEYVGESTYFNPVCDDPRTMAFVILGGEKTIRSYFLDALLPVLGPHKTYFQCTAAEAEVVKYMENAFFATKVTFVNEFREIAEAMGADWHTVREGWLLDPRVEPSHTAVFADNPGFGGKCLPKDLSAIIAAARTAGASPDLLTAVARSNQQRRAALI
jgi:nucleotide sugar dehydrogenase